MSKEYRIDVYDQAGTTRTGTFNPSDLMSARIRRQENSTYELELVCEKASTAYAAIVKKGQLHVVEVGTASVQKFVIAIREEKDRTGLTARVVAEHITMLLANDVVAAATIYADRTLENLLDLVIAGNIGGFTKGTVDVAIANLIIPEFTIGGAGRLDMLHQLRTIAGAVLRVNDDKTIDIKERKVLTGSPQLRLHPEKNLLVTQKVEDLTEQVSRLYGLGGGNPPMTLARTWHKVTASSTIVTDIIFWTNHLGHSDNSYAPRGSTKFFVEIRSQNTGFGPHEVVSTNLDAGINGNVRFAPDPSYPYTIGLVGGEMFRLWFGPNELDAVPVDFIDDKETLDEIGEIHGIREEGDLEPITNLINDPFMETGYSSPPSGQAGAIDDIATYGTATFTENTVATFIQNGESSQRVQTTGFLQGAFIDFDMGLAENGEKNFSAKVLVYLFAGKIQLDISEGDRQNTLGERGTIFEPDQPVVLATAGRWYTIRFSGLSNSLGNNGRIWIYQAQGDGNTADFYIDSVQVEPTAEPSDEWVDGSNQKILWQRCYTEMGETRRKSRDTYTLDMRDLSEEDLALNPYDVFDTSDVSSIVNKELGIDVKLWVKGYDRNVLEPGDTTINVDNESESAEDLQTKMFLDTERQQRKLGLLTSRVLHERTVRATDRKIVVSDPTGVSGLIAFPSVPAPVKGGRVWGMKAVHGLPFMSNLVVPAGYKVMIQFTPTLTASAPSPGLYPDGAPDYFGNEFDMLKQDPVRYLDVRNEVAFSMVDELDNRWMFMKVFVCEQGTHNTDPTALAVNRSNAFHVWIPPGTYDELMLFAYGEPPPGGQPVLFGGPLVLTEVPLVRGHLHADVSAGATKFEISVYPNTTLAKGVGHVIPYGKFKVGEGTNAETISVQRLDSTAFSPHKRELKDSVFANAHKKGEPVVESQAGS